MEPPAPGEPATAPGDARFLADLNLEFLRKHHEELMQAQRIRTQYIVSKLAFVIGLFGLGSIRVGDADFSAILFLVPVVAIGYDLYIQGIDSSVKKAGYFLRSRITFPPGAWEDEWERCISQRRDAFAPFATILFTATVILAAALYLWFLEAPFVHTVAFIVWFFGLLYFALVLHWYYHDFVADLDRADPWTIPVVGPYLRKHAGPATVRGKARGR